MIGSPQTGQIPPYRFQTSRLVLRYSFSGSLVFPMVLEVLFPFGQEWISFTFDFDMALYGSA